MLNLEERIRAIEDRDAIVELTASYCHMARSGNAEVIVDLFCDDGVMEAGDIGQPMKGERGLLPGFREVLFVSETDRTAHGRVSIILRSE